MLFFGHQFRASDPVVLEQVDVPPARYYVLSVLRGSAPGSKLRARFGSIEQICGFPGSKSTVLAEDSIPTLAMRIGKTFRPQMFKPTAHR